MAEPISVVSLGDKFLWHKTELTPEQLETGLLTVVSKHGEIQEKTVKRMGEWKQSLGDSALAQFILSLAQRISDFLMNSETKGAMKDAIKNIHLISDEKIHKKEVVGDDQLKTAVKDIGTLSKLIDRVKADYIEKAGEKKDPEVVRLLEEQATKLSHTLEEVSKEAKERQLEIAQPEEPKPQGGTTAGPGKPPEKMAPKPPVAWEEEAKITLSEEAIDVQYQEGLAIGNIKDEIHAQVDASIQAFNTKFPNATHEEKGKFSDALIENMVKAYATRGAKGNEEEREKLVKHAVTTGQRINEKIFGAEPAKAQKEPTRRLVERLSKEWHDSAKNFPTTLAQVRIKPPESLAVGQSGEKGYKDKAVEAYTEAVTNYRNAYPQPLEGRDRQFAEQLKTNIVKSLQNLQQKDPKLSKGEIEAVRVFCSQRIDELLKLQPKQ